MDNSVTSSIVSRLGAGSGIDMVALANQLASAQFDNRIKRIDDQSTLLDSKISTAGALKAKLLALASALGDRVRTGDLAATPQIANAAVAAVSRPSGSTLMSGSYSLEVLALASRQAIASPPLASAASTTGSGSLTFRFGPISGGAFTQDPGHAAATVTIPTGATLDQVAGAINAAAIGVSAYIATGTDGARLVLKGAEGAANGFTVTATENGSEPGLSALAWDPSSPAPRLLGSAGNARFKLDGLETSTASNTIAAAAPGLSLTLTATNIGAPTTIRFSDPGSSISGAMQDLTSALNDIVASLTKAVDAKTGDLARDGGAQALRRKLSQLAGMVILPDGADGTPRSLSEIGLSTNRDGSFTLNTALLGQALAANPGAVAAMFTVGVNGVFATIDGVARAATVIGDPGSLGGSVERYSALKTRLSDDKAKLDDQLTAFRAQLTKRFAAADSRVGASRSTLSFLQAQISAWNGKGN